MLDRALLLTLQPKLQAAYPQRGAIVRRVAQACPDLSTEEGRYYHPGAYVSHETSWNQMKTAAGALSKVFNLIA